MVDLPAAQAAGFGELNSYFGFTYGDSYVPEDVHNVRGQQTSPDGTTVKLFGEFGPIDGARFRDGFVSCWYGEYEGPIRAGDQIAVSIDFSVDVTGGTLAWSYYAAMFPGYSFDLDMYTGLQPLPPSGQINDFQIQSRPISRAAYSALFECYLHIEWTGYGPTDTLTLTIPHDSVDVTYVPQPTSALLTIAAIALSRVQRGRVHL